MATTVTVTLLFCDFVDSTGLLTRLGEDTAEALRRECFSALRDAVGAHRGETVKSTGDGLAVVFRSTVDAVACAVDMQRAIDRLSRRDPSLALALRVGLSTGEATFHEGDWYGTSVVEAARLCDAAPATGILVSGMTRMLVGSRRQFGFSEPESFDLKGLPEPVNAHRVVWGDPRARPIPFPNQLAMPRTFQFVGREPEIGLVDQALEGVATEGTRRVVVVAGEPGIGKTRLAVEGARSAHERGVTVLAGRCDPEVAVPFRPFVEALRAFAAACSPAELPGRLGPNAGELVRLVPELAGLVPSPGMSAPRGVFESPEAEQFRLYDAVASWLATTSLDGPALLILDDLQWAGRQTIQLLRHVVRFVQPMSVLFLLTYRDTDLGPDDPLSDFLADLRREDGVARISLGSLDHHSVESLVEDAIGRPLEERHVALARNIGDETGGNAFFATEVILSLAEAEALDDPRTRLAPTESVRDIVRRRVRRLSTDAIDALGWAAVVGTDFEVSVLTEAAGLARDRVGRALDEATAAGLLEIAGGGSRSAYSFAHALVRSALYEQWGDEIRVTMHRSIGTVMEALDPNGTDRDVNALAYHFGEAAADGDVAKAIEFGVKAGDLALERLGHEEAVHHFRRALSFLDTAGPTEPGWRCDLLIRLGTAERWAGHVSYRETLLEAAEASRELADPARLTRCALGLGRAFESRMGAVDVERVSVIEDALALADPETADYSVLLAQLAAELVFEDRGQPRVRLSDESLAMARRVGDPTLLAQVLAMRYWRTWDPAGLDAALAEAAELGLIADELGDPFIRFAAANANAYVGLWAGRPDRYRQSVATMRSIAHDLRQPRLQWMAAVNSVAAHITAGSLAEAEREMDEAFEFAETSGQPGALEFYGGQLYLVRWEQGRLDELIDLIAAQADAHPEVPLWQAALISGLCEVGRETEASEAFARSRETVLSDLPQDVFWLMGVSMLGEVAAHLGDVETAGRLYGVLTPFAGQLPTISVGSRGAVDRVLGRLAASRGDLAAADTHFAAAMEIAKRMDAPGWRARNAVDWATTLLDRRVPGALERAGLLLRDAVETARSHGFDAIGARAAALLDHVAS